MYRVLARGTTAGIHCSAGNCLQQTALATPLMPRVAKVDIWEACTELREDSDTDDGDAGERNDNRGGRHQGIVVEIPCKGQSTGSAVQTTEDTSFCILGVLVEAGVLPSRVLVNVGQKIAATTVLRVK